MVGPDVFSIERVPFKRGTNSLGFRGSVPFGTPPSLKPRFLVGQRKLEKVGENRDQEKSFIFMGPSTNLDSTVQRRGLPNKIRTNSPRYIYIYIQYPSKTEDGIGVSTSEPMHLFIK